MTHQAPPYLPIEPLTISERWFPKGRTFGLYERGGVVLPNCTSLLASRFVFSKEAWIAAEPDVDHDAITRESAARGTAVHQALEDWLSGKGADYDPQFSPWVEPLRALVSRGTATLAVEIPVHYVIPGVGGYAGSADGLMLVNNEVVIIDYKTKRPNKRVHPKFLDKQRTQLAAYSIAINELYKDQLPAPVTRTSLLFAHPDEGRKPTVVSTSGDELARYQDLWIEIVEEWYAENGDLVAAEQEKFRATQRTAA